MSDVSIDDFLASLGLGGRDGAQAREILENAGLTRPHKQRIETGKLTRATDEIDRHMRRLCHNCLGRVRPDERRLVQVPARSCSDCGGSNNARAVREMVAACQRSGKKRLVLVGGSPAIRRAFTSLVNGGLKLRLVNGTDSSDRQTANEHVGWADLIVVLGTTQLAHGVSLLYTRNPNASGKLIITSRRGVEAIADEIALKLSAL